MYQLSHTNGQIVAFVKGVTLVNALAFGNLCEYRYKSYIAETRFFRLLMLHAVWVFYVTVMTPISTEFGRSTQDNGRYAIQGHSRFWCQLKANKSYKRLLVSE